MISNLTLSAQVTNLLSSETLSLNLKTSNSSKDTKVLNSNVHTVERITHISYDEFFREYLSKNRPCIFPADITKDWKCSLDWKLSHKPNLGLLDQAFGHLTVPVANCRKCEYNAQPKQEMKMKDFIQYWKETMSKDSNATSNSSLYLKDWHFCSEVREYEPYKLPNYFSSDWLNEACDAGCFQCKEDFRFVYMGPKGSWTPFHADVYRSYSWSANICGKKKWLIYPKGNEEKLKDKQGNLPYDISDYVANADPEIRPIEVYQEEGEIIFIPSGWFHQVHNLEDTISVNHNWLNGCNLNEVWGFLQKELSDVEREISDCKDTMTTNEWDAQCQLLMRINSGMNMSDFLAMLSLLAGKRMAQIRGHIKAQDHHLSENCNNDQDAIQLCRETLLTLATAVERESSQNVRFSELYHCVFDLCCLLVTVADFCRHEKPLDGAVEPEDSCSSAVSLFAELRSSLLHYADFVSDGMPAT